LRKILDGFSEVYNGDRMRFLKKKKKNPSQKPSPLSSLAKDFKALDQEDETCTKKNDGTD